MIPNGRICDILHLSAGSPAPQPASPHSPFSLLPHPPLPVIRSLDMKKPLYILTIVGCFLAAAAINASAQNMPGSLSFSVGGSFSNGVAESSNSVLLTDNNLSNGYASGFDLTDAPSSLNPTGPTGSAAFQWGTPSSSSSYPHASALWFEGGSLSNVAANETFNFGSLYYRNGTIKMNTGASSVDLAINLTFNSPSGIAPVALLFSSDLVNSPNVSDPVASADTVSLTDWYAPLDFYDGSGRRYYFELSFAVDSNTLDGTLSTQDQFRVFEGMTGRADLQGKFTTSPRGMVPVPEPSSAMLALLGALALLRRRR